VEDQCFDKILRQNLQQEEEKEADQDPKDDAAAEASAFPPLWWLRNRRCRFRRLLGNPVRHRMLSPHRLGGMRDIHIAPRDVKGCSIL
jgi:hypothetical protein